MPTQIGSIDLEATNAAKLYAEAGFQTVSATYATKSELTVSADSIRSEVAETYATKDEAALVLSGDGTAVTLDNAADAALKSLHIDGKSVQDGTPSPSSPVPIQSVSTPVLNVGDPSGTYSTTPIDLQGRALCSVPDGTRDGLDVDAEGNPTMVQRTKEVDLGTLTWIHSSAGYFEATNLSDAAEAVASQWVIPAARCENYFPRENFYVINPDSGVNGAFVVFNNTVRVRDSAYTDAAAFKNAVSGVKMDYKLATPQTIALPSITMPTVADGDTLWIDAQVTPNIGAEWWSANGESVSALSSTLTQTAAGLELELSGKVDSDEDWVSWMHAGTDATTHEPYLAMGQDSDYPSVVYGASEAAFYDSEGNSASNVVASFGADGATVGYAADNHIVIGEDGVEVYDGSTMTASFGSTVTIGSGIPNLSITSSDVKINYDPATAIPSISLGHSTSDVIATGATVYRWGPFRMLVLDGFSKSTSTSSGSSALGNMSLGEIDCPMFTVRFPFAGRTSTNGRFALNTGGQLLYYGDSALPANTALYGQCIYLVI